MNLLSHRVAGRAGKRALFGVLDGMIAEGWNIGNPGRFRNAAEILGLGRLETEDGPDDPHTLQNTSGAGS